MAAERELSILKAAGVALEEAGEVGNKRARVD